jgi:uncharacterized protein YndB with AHSA1/START domain
MSDAPYDPGPLRSVSCEPAGERWALVFARELAHPVERVWAALCDPGQLRVWSPFSASRPMDETGPVVLQMIPDGDELASRVLIVDPPHVLEHTWGEDLLRWELREAGSHATLLTLRHVLGDRGIVPSVCAGWHICLDAADALLAGAPLGPVQADNAKNFGWDGLRARYAGLLGEDSPTGG